MTVALLTSTANTGSIELSINVENIKAYTKIIAVVNTKRSS